MHSGIKRLILLGLILAVSAVARADTRMDVEVGWGWRPRAERWTPVFVTAATDKPRNVLLTIEWPQGGSYSMRIQQAMTIDVGPRTFPILLPVHGWEYEQASFTLSDRDSGKSLAHYPKNTGETLGAARYTDASSTFVGVSGASSTLSSLQEATGSTNVGFLESRRLPTVPLGFDCLNVLVLNGPNLGGAGFGPAPLDDLQQQAIVDWVRAGGALIIWPGDGGVPANGPLAAVLPAKVGVREDLPLSPADLAAIGLSARFKTLAAYRLEPCESASPIPLFNRAQTSAFSSRLGLGRIVLSPVNIGELAIADTPHARNLWRPLLKGMVAVPVDPDAISLKDDTGQVDSPAIENPQPTPGYVINSYGSNDEDAQEKSAAIQIADFLGNVPGAGQIGFSYIAYVLIGLMFVVGPVDWFVLKKLGRQPWTWVTTTGWAAFVTLGALFAGYLFKSGDLHYKTLQTIDQVGDATIASTDFVSLYSSQTRTYELATDSAGWWQPTGFNEFGSSGLKLDIDFHQTSTGSTPLPMVVNVWSLRFLRGDHCAPGPAILSADLKADMPEEGAPQVSGTIKNLSDMALKNIRVVTQRGSNSLTLADSAVTTMPAGGPESSTRISIAPHAAVAVRALLVPPAPIDPATRLPGRYYGQPETPTEADLWRVAANLNYRRGNLMRFSVAGGHSAIIYAEVENPTPATKLSGQPAIEKHYQFIRALVDLHEEGGK